MHYPDGQAIRLGDRMALRDGSEATVVCSIDTEEYSPDYPREHWAYPHRGIFTCHKPALVQCTETEGDAAVGEKQDLMLGGMIPRKTPMRNVR